VSPRLGQARPALVRVGQLAAARLGVVGGGLVGCPAQGEDGGQQAAQRPPAVDSRAERLGEGIEPVGIHGRRSYGEDDDKNSGQASQKCLGPAARIGARGRHPKAR
jgi:hypothetical protein